MIYKGLQRITTDYKGLQRYDLQRMTKDYNGLQRYDLQKDYNRLQRITKI